MKRIEMTRRETAILLPGQVFGFPDNIAEQIIRRGSGKDLDASPKDESPKEEPQITEPKKKKA